MCNPIKKWGGVEKDENEGEKNAIKKISITIKK